MPSIASSFAAKRKLQEDEEEESTMKRTASTSSLGDRIAKRIKTGSKGSQFRLADGLREEGWAGDEAAAGKRVRMKDMPVAQLDEIHRSAFKREQDRKRRRSSLGSRKG